MNRLTLSSEEELVQVHQNAPSASGPTIFVAVSRLFPEVSAYLLGYFATDMEIKSKVNSLKQSVN